MTWGRRAAAALGCVAAVSLAAAGMQHVPRIDWHFTDDVMAVPVFDSAGRPLAAPFLGGFDVPRPQLVDLHGTGQLDPFVQEWPGQLMQFEQVKGHWTWRTDKYQDIDIGQWYRFVDMDGDGRVDLLSEMPEGYIRLWHNAGTAAVPRFVAQGDTIRDVDGLPIAADRQNILNAVDIDCNGRIDLFIGRVQGVVDRFEQEGTSPDGSPRFRLISPNWEGIEILGPEQTQGSVIAPPMSDTGSSGPHSDLEHSGSARHGANTLAFADLSGRGVLDLFWGDFFEPGLLQIPNTGSCAQPNLQNKPVRFPVARPLITSGYNAATFGDIDGDGNIDLLVGVIGGAYGPARTSINNLYALMQKPRGTWTTTTHQLITQIDVGSEAAPVLADLRGSGTLDLLVGSKLSPTDQSTGTITWFENVGTPLAPAFRERGVLPIHGEFNYTPRVVDLDGDGLPDIVAGTWRDRLVWYRNTGTRAAPAWTLADSALVTIPRGTNTVPAFADIDGDGLLDLLVGSASGRLALYRNSGTRTSPHFTLVTASFQEIKFGRRAAPLLIDMDGDGKPDLVLGNDAGEIQLWHNVSAGPGDFRFALDSTFHMTAYPDAVPAGGDLHGTGHVDLLVGTSAGGIRWYENHSTRP